MTDNLKLQAQRVTQAQTELEAINADLAQAETALQQAQQNLDAHQAERQQILARQAEAEQQVRQLSTRLTERQSRLAQTGERREWLLTEQTEREVEISRLTKQLADLQKKQEQLTTELTTLDETLFRLEENHTQQRSSLAQLDAAAAAWRDEVATLNRQEDALKARQDVLDKLRSDMAGYFEGVKAVMQPEAKLSGIIGPLSQIIQVPSRLEVAIETALGSRLQDVVVETFTAAEAAIGYLKQNRRGRATFLPLDTIRTGGPATVPAMPGIVGLASTLIDVEPHLQPIIDLTLNRTLIVEDLPAARRAFAAMKGGFQIVSLEGEIMRSGGAVTGGRAGGKHRQQGTFLAREREWRALPGQLAEVSQKKQDVSNRLDQNRQEATNVAATLRALESERQDTHRRRQEVQDVVDKVNRGAAQLTDNIGWQQELQHKVANELDHLSSRQTEIEAEVAQLEQEQQTAEQTARHLAAEVSAYSAEKLLTELSQAKSDVTLIQGRQKNQQAILTNHQATRQQLANQIESKQSRAETLAVERDDLLQQQTALRVQRTDFDQQLANFMSQIGQTEQRLAELEKKQTELEQAESSARQHLQRLEVEHNRISLEAARRQDELDNLQRQIQDDLGLVQLEMTDEQVGQPVLPIQPLVSELPVVEELPPGVEEDVTRLKIQVRRLGNVNPDAPREYAELKERHEFLTNQMADLEAAAADLKEIIAKLDETMEAAFAETFKRVAQEFQRYFKALFGGGEAKLLLTDPDNLIESGVDIAARPPGKRLQSLALLSGGERSLTAQALIFSLLKISPTPFVIFDEVDAMLDEANVSRFRDALSALANDIQFIIITHNRKTIEAAATIYGISMGQDSVSQAFSLKIDDWVEERAA